ncbi:MAG: hypothetical protein KDB48_05295 [Solirubrobacterales bacterium]|nr:hypothetical protein [Solirubrobacterales bacterium]HMT06316.1 hypothetical protein [Solirubrobacterales bacterium]
MFETGDGVLNRMIEVPYEAEDVLQELLAKYPGLLAGDSARGESDWLLIQREIGISETEDSGARWSLDHLFVDRDAIPTLVEVKRSSDSRIRREVVGQMLDYAANGSAVWSQESIRTSFESGAERDGRNAETELADFLGDEDPERFWNRVGANLRLGRLRLVFVADEVPRELRRIIEFLNEQMESTEVIGLEVKQFAAEGGSATTLMSSVIGRSEAARQVKGGSSPRVQVSWSLEDFFREVAKRTESEAIAGRVMRLHELLIQAGASYEMGKGSTAPTVNYYLARGTDFPVRLNGYTYGIGLGLSTVMANRSDGEMSRLLALVREVPGAVTDLEDIGEGDWNTWPTLTYANLLSAQGSEEAFAEKVIEAAKPSSES